MKIIIISSIYRIRKDELPGVVRATLGIVQKYNPVELGIKPFFDLLSEKESQLNLFLEPRQHPLTSLIVDDRKRRKDLVSAIEGQMNAVDKSKVSSLAGPYALILPLVKKYLTGFKQNNTKSADEKLLSFISEIGGNELLTAAAVALGINIYIDELKEVQAKLNDKNDKRREDNSTRRVNPTAQLKSGIITSLANLLKAIELTQVHQSTENLASLIAELNEFYVPYRALSRSRVTRSRNEAIKNETVAMSTTTSATATNKSS